MKSFLIKIFLYSCFVALIFSYPIYILISSKENLYNIDNIYKGDEHQKYLVGYAYNEENYGYLKYSHIINNPRYTVMALGSSRVLQFRAAMFEVPFYNAGYTIKTIGEFEQFLRLIPDEKMPEYLLIGLDQWMFNENFASKFKNSEATKWTDNNSVSYTNTLNNIRPIIKDIQDGRIQYPPNSKNEKTHKIGLNAVINNKGFRNDGSILYGKHIEMLNKKDTTARDYGFKNTFHQIKQGEGRWKYGDEVSNDAINKLNHLADYCKTKGIKLVAFLPPYANKVYRKMQQSDNYEYITRIAENIKNENFEFYQFNSSISCDSNDNEMIDGLHGGEKTYLRILLSILDKNTNLNEICNKEKLKSELRSPINNHLVFDY
jgi:hypothetical protein